MRSVRNATSSAPSPSRHSFAPYASPTAMRTTEIGACTPPCGITPGIRRPVRTMTLAADLLAQDPVRRADVVDAFGRDRRRLQTEPVLADRRGRLEHDLVLGRTAILEREVVTIERDARARSPRGRERAAPPRAAPARSRLLRARRSSACVGSYGRGYTARMARRRGWRREGSQGSVSTTTTRAGQPDHGSGEARANRGARDSAGVEGRLDLAAARRPSCRRRASTRPGRRQYLYHPDYRARAGARRSSTSSCASRSGCRICARRWRSTWTVEPLLARVGLQRSRFG